jgi:mono/diheme cytochrome c family protein
MMKKNVLFVIVFGLALVLGASGCSFSLAQDITPPPGYQPSVFQETAEPASVFPVVKPDSTAGESIFVEKCQPCHGQTGLGDGAQSLNLPVKVGAIGTLEFANQSAPLAWYNTVLNGNLDNFMPPFSGSLSEGDIWDVLAYVYALGASPQVIAEGEQAFQTVCADCHGAQGKGDGAPGAADLTDPEKMVSLSGDDIILKILTGNGNPDHIFADDLDAEAQVAVAAHVRSLVFGSLETGELVPPLIPETTQPPAVESTQEPSAGGEETGEGGAVSTQEGAGEEVAEAPASGGTVFGTVENGSGSGLPAGMEVTLYGYDHFEEVFNRTTRVDESGHFEFEGVELTEGFVFFTMADYMDTSYSSEFHIAGPDETEVDLSVVVYETTTDPSDLVVDRLHVFFTYPTPDIVQVIHSLSISNQGNKTLIPASEGETSVEFTLPEGATNLAFEQGDIGQPYITTADGFGDPMPIAPGTDVYQLLYAYELPYDRQMEWVQPFNIPTNLVVLFVPDSKLEVKGDQLQASGVQALNNVDYQVYVSGEMAAGDELQVEISGRNPSAGSGLALNTNTTSLVVGAFGLGLAAVGVWWWFRMDRDDERFSDGGKTTESIMDEIIALDEAYEAGEVEDAVYQARRSRLKARLKEMVE